MESLNEYREDALRLGEKGFVEKYDHPFLLKPPGKELPSEPPNSFSFRTEVARISIDPYGNHWRVSPIKKRPENPFPDRLTIGRAPNCDVVVRVPFVSKVNAHLNRLEDGKWQVSSARNSTTAVFVNGRQVGPADAKLLAIGDIVSFGSLNLELADAERFYHLLISLRA